MLAREALIDRLRSLTATMKLGMHMIEDNPRIDPIAFVGMIEAAADSAEFYATELAELDKPMRTS
jgi:hypothetical protein